MSRLINQLSPNPRLQRTRLRSPLSRKPLDAGVSRNSCPTGTGWRTLRVFGLLLGLAAVQGCSSVTITYLDPAYRPETQPESIPVLHEEPIRPYKVVARFQFQDRGWNFSKDELEWRIRSEAGRFGGEAVLVEQNVENHFVTEGLLIGHTAEVSQLVIFAKVIVFRETAAR